MKMSKGAWWASQEHTLVSQEGRDLEQYFWTHQDPREDQVRAVQMHVTPQCHSIQDWNRAASPGGRDSCQLAFGGHKATGHQKQEGTL